MTCLLSGAMAFGSANAAFAQLAPGTPLPGNPGFTMAFDENGHVSINGQTPPVTVLNGGGLLYDIPGPVAFGDVWISTPGDITAANPNGISDVLEFLGGNSTGFTLGYFSLRDENSPPDLADTGGLVPPPNPPFLVMETGPEGNNGFQWIATDPSTGLTAIYNGISDIPEPSTFLLGSLGLVALFLIGRRRRTLKEV